MQLGISKKMISRRKKESAFIMRKQTKLVAVLSAAALLAVGASMTSFAGWEKDEDGIWHYYDSDDEMVTGEWRKDGSKWFYLDDDGNMATDAWVDDEYSCRF